MISTAGIAGRRMARRVVVVCMLDSIHTARWLHQFRDEEIEFVLMPSSPHRRLRPELKALIDGGGKARFRLVRASGISLFLWLVDRVLSDLVRGLWLRSVIAREQPEVLHALELQNAGYMCLRALSNPSFRKPKLIATNWGSDLFWFSRFPKHSRRLRQLLRIADFYSAECIRDVNLAKSLGFQGEVLPVIPNSGGFSSSLLREPLVEPGERNLILVKGYHGWAGRAHVALRALENMGGQLGDHEVIVYSANFSTKLLADAISRRSVLTIRHFGKGRLSHRQMLELYSRAKIHIGISLTDGISTALLESMAFGAIPVQTSTSCCDEWLQGTGVIVQSLDQGAIEEAVRQAWKLSLDSRNLYVNRKTIVDRASEHVVFQGASKFYLQK